MATLTRGYTFGATEQVTNSKLHSLVDSATLSAIVQADLTAGLGLVTRATSAPSDTDQLWIDTSTTPATLKVSDGSNWLLVGTHAILTNRTGQTTSVGQVCVIDTSNSSSFKFTSTEGDLGFAGVTIEAIANLSSQDLAINGFVTVLLETSASAGCFLRTSTATGKAVQVASGNAGTFAQVVASGSSSAVARLFGQALHGTTSASGASQAEMEAGTNTANPVVPGRAHFHQAAAKAWIRFDGTTTGTSTGAAKFNVSDVVRNNTGDYTVTFSTAMSSVNYLPFFFARNLSVPVAIDFCETTLCASTNAIEFTTNRRDTAAAIDCPIVCLLVYGDI